MEACDGNAVGGQLLEFFGLEMTTASGRCRHCGSQAVIAELRVYVRAPGTVVRCRSCGAPVIVIVTRDGAVHVNFDSFELLGRYRLLLTDGGGRGWTASP
jgi:hypothetical protein